MFLSAKADFLYSHIEFRRIYLQKEKEKEKSYSWYELLAISINYKNRNETKLVTLNATKWEQSNCLYVCTLIFKTYPSKKKTIHGFKIAAVSGATINITNQIYAYK